MSERQWIKYAETPARDFIQKVQAGLLARFRGAVQREVAVYPIEPKCSMDIRLACEEARRGYEDGEPRIPLFELIAYLIIAKLARYDMWGGTALNKNLMWAEDLPNGGFPKGICTKRDILQVADSLFNARLLIRKTSKGKLKYGLGDKRTIQPILDSADSVSLPGPFRRSLTEVLGRSLRGCSSTTKTSSTVTSSLPAAWISRYLKFPRNLKAVVTCRIKAQNQAPVG